MLAPDDSKAAGGSSFRSDSLEKTLGRLLEQGFISYDTALAKANFPKELGRAPTAYR